jgi:hypothetical protein
LKSAISGVSPDLNRPDNIIYDLPATPASPNNTQGNVGASAGGFGHPLCLNTVKGDEALLPAVIQ